MIAPRASSLAMIAPGILAVGAIVQILIARLCTPRTKGIVALLTCLPVAVVVSCLIPAVRAGGCIDLHLFVWDGLLAAVLHADALSVLFALMGAGLGAIVLLYSISYMEHDRAASRFYATMLLFIGGFIALVLSANLLLFYFCWEVIGLCSFSLVGFWYTDREAVHGARKVLLMTHIAGYGLLAAVLTLYHRSGTVLWTDNALHRSLTGGVFLLMLIALIAKSVQVPLHTWIPEAMAAPTPVSSLLHAACYVTAGVYLAARLHSFGVWAPMWGTALVWIGCLTMVVGVMYAMVQTDLKRMLAFSTVSQIGYMMMGLGIGTSLAIAAGLLHCLNHGFFKGGLFLNAGAVQHAAGTRDMNQLGGLAQRMPRTTFTWLIGVASMAGIPLMSGFVSKWMLYTAALEAGWPGAALVAWVVSLGTVFLCAKATSVVFLGPATEKTENAKEAPVAMQWAMALMACGSIVLGVAPQIAVHYLLAPILAALSLNTDLQVTWFGLFSGTGSFSTAGGLVLAVISLVVGGAIYSLAYVVRPTHLASAAGGIFTGGEPLSEEAGLTAGDFSRIFEQYWRPFFRWSNVDRIYLAAWHDLESLSRMAAVLVAWMERHASALTVLLAAVLLPVGRWMPSTTPAVAARASPWQAAHVPTLLIVACGAAAAALFMASLAQPAWRRLAPWIFLVGAAAVVGIALPDAHARLALVEGAALLTIPLVYQFARTRPARSAYLTAVVLSVGLRIVADGLHDDGNWTSALLLTSTCLKLAAVPFLFWLLRLADELPALVLGLIIAVIDMAAFGELAMSTQLTPHLLMPRSLWLIAAAASSLVAALLMLVQRDLKRLLVLSTVEDVGFLFLGITSVRSLGYSGALIAAASHALAKALLFASLSGPERAGALRGGCGGLAIRYPVSAFGFLFGMLAMVGVPPTVGYIGRWRLYETALEMSPLLLATFIVSSAFALIAYALALTRIWWGPAGTFDSAAVDRPTREFPEPLLLRTAILAMVALLLVAGIWPGILQRLSGGAL